MKDQATNFGIIQMINFINLKMPLRNFPADIHSKIFFQKGWVYMRGWLLFLQSNFQFLSTRREKKEKHHFVALRI